MNSLYVIRSHFPPHGGPNVSVRSIVDWLDTNPDLSVDEFMAAAS